jgi:Lipocalin-like domain
MRVIVVTAFIGLIYAAPVRAQVIDLVKTYRLISEERTIVATGEVIPTKNPTGYITYTREGRMVALIVRGPRPKPDKVENLTDAQRVDLFRTMTAYGGTYTFDGKKTPEASKCLPGDGLMTTSCGSS